MGLISNDHAYIVTVQFMQKKGLSSACNLQYTIFFFHYNLFIVYFGTRKIMKLGEQQGLERSSMIIEQFSGNTCYLDTVNSSQICSAT